MTSWRIVAALAAAGMGGRNVLEILTWRADVALKLAEAAWTNRGAGGREGGGPEAGGWMSAGEGVGSLRRAVGL